MNEYRSSRSEMLMPKSVNRLHFIDYESVIVVAIIKSLLLEMMNEYLSSKSEMCINICVRFVFQ